MDPTISKNATAILQSLKLEKSSKVSVNIRIRAGKRTTVSKSLESLSVTQISGDEESIKFHIDKLKIAESYWNQKANHDRSA